MQPLKYLVCSLMVLIICFCEISNGEDCSWWIRNRGCYKWIGGSYKQLNHLLLNDRDGSTGIYINWTDYHNYLESFICRCANKAFKEGYKTFGIQFWGECWGSKNLISEDSITKYDDCANGFYEKCRNVEPPLIKKSIFLYMTACSGKAYSTYVYDVGPVPRSCNDVWNFGRRVNGMYNIDGAGLIYCHMTDIPGCGGEGWTQVIKMDGNKDTFAFNSPLWTNKMTHKENISQGMGNSEVKTTAYWTIPFEKVCVGMKVGNYLKWVVIQHKSLSLYHLIADGKYRPTSLGRQSWKSLISGSSLQTNCNRQGFNVNTVQQLRIGISSNNEDDCNSNDSAIGFGRVGRYGYGNESCGNIARAGGDNGNKNIAAWGYIFVQ